MKPIPVLVMDLKTYLPYAILAGAIVVFLLIQAWMNHRARIRMQRDLTRAQEALFARSAQELAVRLTEYTDQTLLKKVDESYSTLISKELLPGVNQAAQTMAELSAAVVARQEQGMTELAKQLSTVFTEELRRYVRDEAQLISEVRSTSADFADKLTAAAVSVEQTAARYADVFQKTSTVQYALLETFKAFGQQIVDLTGLLGKATDAFGQIHTALSDSTQLAAGLGETVEQMRASSQESAFLLATQNEKVATLLNDAVSAMQANTENSAKAILDEFGRQLADSTASIKNFMETFHNMNESMRATAEEFTSGIIRVSERMETAAGTSYQKFTETLSETATKEYERFASSAEAYSGQILGDIVRLSETLDGHISNLQIVTQQLGNSVSSFHGDVSTSTAKFEMGMEKTIEAALEQLDHSLAEIIKRLVSVTANIEEAAGALPRAVRSITQQ